MAKAKKLPSGSWRVRVFDHEEIRNGKKVQVTKSFTVADPTPRGRRECERLAAEWAASKREELTTEATITVSEAMDRCLDAKQDVLSPSTLRSYHGLRDNAYDELLDVPIGRLTQEKIQRWIDRYSRDHSPKTCRNAHGFLVAAVSMFRPDFHVKTRLPQPVPVEYVTPTDEEIALLVAETKGTALGRAILLAAFGTLRAGEVCALTPADIKGNVVTVSKSMAIVRGGGTVIKQPKNSSSVRKILYPEAVIRELRAVKSGPLVDIHPHHLAEQLHREQEKLGISRFRYHDLRAYSASVMHAIGVPDAYIMERGGWRTDSTLKKVYRRAMSDEAALFYQQVNRKFEKLIETP